MLSKKSIFHTLYQLRRTTLSLTRSLHTRTLLITWQLWIMEFFIAYHKQRLLKVKSSKNQLSPLENYIWVSPAFWGVIVWNQNHVWVNVFKNDPSKICGRNFTSKFLKAVFHKFCLVHSWIPWPIWSHFQILYA